MAALRWSSILECIIGPVLCWPWTSSAYVYIAWIWHVLLQYDVIIISLLSYAMCYPKTLQWRCRCYVDPRWLNVCDGCRVDPKQIARTFVQLHACSDWNVLLVFDVYRCNKYDDVVTSSILLSKYTTYCRLAMTGRKGSTFASLYVWIWYVLLLFDVVWGCK